MKEIWSGTWSSGSITIPEFPYYNILLMRPDGKATLIPVFRRPEKLNEAYYCRGVGMYPYVAQDSSHAFGLYGMYANQPSYTSTTLTAVKFLSFSIYSYNTTGNLVANETIGQIFGIL